jgi:hypothetical protein
VPITKFLTFMSQKVMAPPAMQVVPRIKKTYRYNVTGSPSGTAVTVGSLLAAMGAIGTVANTTIVSLCSSVRIKKIKIWPALNAAGSGNSLDTYVVWASSIANQPDEKKDATLQTGSTVGRSMIYRPQAKSLGSFVWNSTSAATVLFNITAPQGSIVDITLDGWFANSIAPYAQAVGTATVGSVYFGCLDGSTTHLLPPVGLLTTH